VSYQLGNAKVWDGTQWVEAVGGFPANGSNVSGADVLSVCRAWTEQSPNELPWPGGTVTIDGKSLGFYDWVWKNGNQTIAAAQSSDWFTATQDTHSAWIIVDGDLTINSGAELRPPSRKLFTVVYVTGDLVCNGTISMTSRGANHSGVGSSEGSTTAEDILIATGTFSGVVDPKVPASGGAGGAGVLAGSNANFDGINGSAGSLGGTGGGGSGGTFGTNATSGAGANGTSFSGGAGGGGIVVVTNVSATAESGGANGGKGGDPTLIGNNASGAGGGNPGGVNTVVSLFGVSGIGGVLIVIVEGQLSGSGVISANSLPNLNATFRTGGGMGGGSVTVMSGSDISSVTPLAAGSLKLTTANLSAGSAYGGGGGAGTARKLTL
jgi:hypothetical protein